MATKNIVPRGNLEGGLGTSTKRWNNAYVGNLDVSGNTKLTFANGSITDVATQAEAESGTDNTKVMTPLRVQQEMLKFPANSLKLLHLGSFANKTIQDLRNAIDNWLGNNLEQQGCMSFSASGNWFGLWNDNDYTTILGYGGRWYIHNIAPYQDANYTQLLVTSYGDKLAYLVYKTNGQWGSLRKLATNGALSMPSDSRISVSFSTHSGSPDYYNVGVYTAPTDGWLSVSTTATYIAATIGSTYVASSVGTNSSSRLTIFVPMGKGQEIAIASQGETDSSSRLAFFHYAQSEV